MAIFFNSPRMDMRFVDAMNLKPEHTPDSVLELAWTALGLQKLIIRQENPESWNCLHQITPGRLELRRINLQLDKIIDEVMYRQASAWAKAKGVVAPRKTQKF